MLAAFFKMLSFLQYSLTFVQLEMIKLTSIHHKINSLNVMFIPPIFVNPYKNQTVWSENILPTFSYQHDKTSLLLPWISEKPSLCSGVKHPVSMSVTSIFAAWPFAAARSCFPGWATPDSCGLSAAGDNWMQLKRQAREGGDHQTGRLMGRACVYTASDDILLPPSEPTSHFP